MRPRQRAPTRPAHHPLPTPPAPTAAPATCSITIPCLDRLLLPATLGGLVGCPHCWWAGSGVSTTLPLTRPSRLSPARGPLALPPLQALLTPNPTSVPPRRSVR